MQLSDCGHEYNINAHIGWKRVSNDWLEEWEGTHTSTRLDLAAVQFEEFCERHLG
jgi:hypothetical protein